MPPNRSATRNHGHSPEASECSKTSGFSGFFQPSATARGQQNGAGEGNRTLVVSLGSFCSAIELHPHFGDLAIGQVRAEGTCLCRHRRRRSLGSYRSTATGGLSILKDRQGPSLNSSH